MCNDYGNHIPYDDYLRAFSQIRLPLRWPKAALWAVIREWQTDLRPIEVAEMAEVSHSYTRHVMARLAREGILRREAEACQGEDGQLVSAIYELVLDLGPTAPILHGGLLRGAAGYTDPNLSTAA